MANTGDIPSNVTVGAGESIRRNSGDSAFEAFDAVETSETSTTDKSIVVFDGTSGKLIQDTSYTGSPQPMQIDDGGVIKYISGLDSNGEDFSINADAIFLDTLAEYTSHHGVDIETVNLKDGLVDGRDVAVDGAKLDRIQYVSKESGQYYSMLGRTDASTSLAINAAGNFQSIPVYLDAGSYDRIAVISTVAAASTWRFGVYPTNPATGLPDGQTLTLDCGTIDTNATAGLLTATISLTIPTSGVYWLALLIDSYTATPTVHGWTTVGAYAQPPLYGTPVNNSAATAGRHAISRQTTGISTGSMPATHPSCSWGQNAVRIQVRAA